LVVFELYLTNVDIFFFTAVKAKFGIEGDDALFALKQL